MDSLSRQQAPGPLLAWFAMRWREHFRCCSSATAAGGEPRLLDSVQPVTQRRGLFRVGWHWPSLVANAGLTAALGALPVLRSPGCVPARGAKADVAAMLGTRLRTPGSTHGRSHPFSGGVF